MAAHNGRFGASSYSMVDNRKESNMSINLKSKGYDE